MEVAVEDCMVVLDCMSLGAGWMIDVTDGEVLGDVGVDQFWGSFFAHVSGC